MIDFLTHNAIINEPTNILGMLAGSHLNHCLRGATAMAISKGTENRKEVKICSIDGCSTEQDCRGMCSRHLWQMKHYGQIMNTARKRGEPNRFTLENEVAVMILDDHWGREKAKVLLDAKDIETVSKHKWFLLSQRKGRVLYAHTRINGKFVRLHSFILNFQGDRFTQIDHINRDGLDNRRVNLRIGSSSQNHANSAPRSNKTGYRGVEFDDRKERYYAHIRVKNKTQYIGCFKTAVEAARAYNEEAVRVHGEFATLNVLTD